MKYIKLFIATVCISLLTVSCDRDLPYPLTDVKEGVVVDIIRTTGTDGVLTSGDFAGDYKVTLSIPKQQGDYSHLDYVQLLCVFTDANRKTTAKVIKDNIKEFPAEVTLDIAAIYQEFGLTSPALGETCEITTNSVLKDGYVVYGWNEYSGFNNKTFTGWDMGGRAYSYSVRYPVVCPLDLDEFIGTMTVTDNWNGEIYDANCVKVSDTELKIEGFFEGKADLTIYVDNATHTVSIPKQLMQTTYYTYTNLSLVGAGTIDACNNIIKFTATFTVDQGSFGNYGIELRVAPN